MSVPTHNLYDFIYQVLENRYILMYFYPWGSKELQDTCAHSPKGVHDIYMSYTDVDPHLMLHDDSNILQHIRSNNTLTWDDHRSHSPLIFCYDQEPLNFDYYKDLSVFDLGKDYVKQRVGENRPPFEYHRGKNLKLAMPMGKQKTWILLHSELNSHEVEKYNNTDEFFCAYWWSHAMLSLDWYRFAEIDTSLKPGVNIKKLFLIYSRDTTGSRQYRQVFLDNIKNKEDCQIGSFYVDNISSNDSAIYNVNDINYTAISVILETVFDDRIHLTEKTCRALATGHPFILFNGPGSLEYLRSYGFKTFDPIINEHYDTVIDSNERMQCIITEMERLTNLNSESIQQLLEIAEHNKQVFWSKNFRDQIISELVNNVKDARSKFIHEIDWDYYVELYKFRKEQNHPNMESMEAKYMLAWLEYREKGGTLENYVPPDLD